MKTVTVALGARSYDIRIGLDLPAGIGLGSRKAPRVLVISDSNVDPLYGEAWSRALTGQGALVCRTVVAAGESSKDLKFLQELYDKALGFGLDRSSVVVALGGGVVGDLAGFMAATFLRGVALVQAPTTLLAMVDSSVGGKTGVNLSQGKNLVGSFYQPVEVVVDLRTLETLPEREYLSGLAEVVKYGVIRDAALFCQLESNIDKLRDRDLDFLEPIVARCCEIKAEVVADDERESGVRAILNYGHTLAHALEQVSGYTAWLHGEALSTGMVYAAELSVRTRGLDAGEAGRIRSMLNNLGLPLDGSRNGEKPAWSDIRPAMNTDKKTLDGRPRWVLATEIGSVTFGHEVDEEVMAAAYASL